MIICKREIWNGYFVSGKLKNCTRLPNKHTTHSTTHTLNFGTKIQIFSLLLPLKFPNSQSLNPKPSSSSWIIKNKKRSNSSQISSGKKLLQGNLVQNRNLLLLHLLLSQTSTGQNWLWVPSW